MQTRPDNWEALFSGPHKTEYKFLIDGVEYSGSDLQGTPCLTKPLMDQPTFGRCCSGTLTLSVRKKSGVEIPKAATVVARCRLSSKDGATVTDWVEQGHFCVSKRQGRDIISLTCRDLMGKSGEPYAPRATFEEWPVPMTDVVEEIAAIMGVTVDPRTVINTGLEYVVTRPSDDTLMSEVLAGIAAAHFGSWIMNEKGQLRLVTVSMWGAAPIRQEIGRAYGKYTPISTAQRVSRLTLIDSADNVFTVGDDTGRELVSQCEYATQSMCDSLLDGAEIVGAYRTGLPGSVRARTYNTKTGEVSGRNFVFPFKQFPAVSFVPYTLTGAYIDPCLELGDTVAIDCRGTRVELVLASMTIRCNMSYNADVSFEVEQDDEDEYPYTDLQTLQASRVVSTHKSYYGTKISRESGFVSDRIVDGEVVARLTANADTFAMQQLVDGDWEDRIYFDPVKKKYVLTGEVEVNGVLTVADLENKQEKTFINGANIVTGTLTANTITSGALKSKDGTLVLDLDNNKLTIGGDDILDAIAKVDNQLSISADSQLFVREDGMEDYTPTKITLKAETRGALKSFQWSKDGSAIVGATSDTLNIIPTDFAGNSSTYSVTAVDEYGNPYSAFLTIAKLTGGEPGSDGYNTATINLYKRSSTAPTIDWADSLKYIFADPPGLEAVPAGWSTSIPAGTEPLYVTSATAYSNISYDFIKASEWSTPIILAANGANGEQGYSTAISYLYKRSKTRPSIDWENDLIYSFSGKGLTSVPAGWSESIPDGTDPLYVTAAVAFGKTDTVQLTAASWDPPAMMAESGSDGESGYNAATVFLYARAASAPEKPAEALVYTFATGDLSGSLGVWSRQVPDTDGNPCYVTQATASSRSATVTIVPEKWSAPAAMVIDGQTGENGERGTGVLAVTTAPTSYTTVTEGVRPYYRIPLTTVVTESGVGDPRIGDVLRYSYYEYPVTLVFEGYVYTGRRVSVRGADGVPGANTAVIHLYKRAETRPTVDWTDPLTYSFPNKSLESVPAGWSQEIVDGYDALYVISATAYGTGDTDSIDPAEWSEAVKLAEDGCNNATVFLYQRADSSPEKPTGDLTYTFADGTLTGSFGAWKTTLPDIDGNPCYVIQATATSRLPEDIIRASEWSAPVKLVENGYNTATVFLYQRKNVTPAKPTGDMVYTFADGSLSGALGGWSKTIPDNDGNPCYIIQATAISPNASFTIPAAEWSAPALFVENGQAGEGGDDGYTAILSRQYVMVNVDVERKPTVAESVSCNVQVYKGLTPLSATNSTPGENQYRVEVTNTATGITVTQSTPGALVISVSKTTAIADTSVLQLEMTTGDGIVLRGNIVIQANMNAIVATHESRIDTLDDEIVLKVSENQYHAQMPTYSSSDPSTNWTADDKSANTGYLWYDTANKALKKWTGTAWTTAPDDTWASHAESSMSLTANKIGWLVKSGTSASDFTMTDRAMQMATSALNIVTEDASASFTVESVSGASYGFALTDDGYYTSQNAGVDSSWAWCRVRVNTAVPLSLVLSCINYAESNFDYGMIGKVDTALTGSTTYTSADVLYSFRGQSSASVVTRTIEIPAGSHFFDVQFIKDGSTSMNNDSFKFMLPNPSVGSRLTLRSGTAELSSSNIIFSGLVTFKSLEDSGATVINGDNIRTGTLTGIKVVTETLINTVGTSKYYELTSMDAGGINCYTERRVGSAVQATFNIGRMYANLDVELDTCVMTLESKAGYVLALESGGNLLLEAAAGGSVNIGNYENTSIVLGSPTSYVNWQAGTLQIILNTNFGTAGQVLKSGGSSGSCYWGSSGGVSCDLLWSGSLKGTSSAYHYAAANDYKYIVVIGKVSSTGSLLSCVLPISDSVFGSRFQITDEAYFMSFYHYQNYIQRYQGSSGAVITHIYGIK